MPTMVTPDPRIAATTKNLHVFELNVRTDLRWERFVHSHPDASIYHHPGWLSALESEYGQTCVGLACEDADGQICAVLPLFYTKGLPIDLGAIAGATRLSSLPRTPLAGPLALNDRAAIAVVQHAVKLVASRPGLQLEIKTHIPSLERSVEQLSCTPWRPTYVEELPPATDGARWEEFWENVRLPRTCTSCEGCRRLRFGNAKRQHRVNWAVNKAVKLGLRVREAQEEEDLARWYPLYLLTMRHNAVPPRPYRFFRALWSSLHSRLAMRLLLAEREQDGQTRLVAGSILLQFGQTVFYAFTGCAPEDFRLHPHDLLQIEAIRGACRGGFRWYDFGEVTEDHQSLAQFKTKWGGYPKPLYRYYYPARLDRASDGPGRLTSSARAIWRRLPTKVTAALGDFIYRRM